MKIKSILAAVAWRLTPWKVLQRQYRGISGSFTRTAQRIREAKEVVSRQKSGKKAEYQNLTPEEIFEAHCQAGNWTERGLRVRSGRLRVTKWVWLIAGAFSIAGAVRLFITWPWTAMIVPVVMLAFACVCLARAAIGGWCEYQIYTRSMIPFRAFMGRREFFRFWLF